MILLEVNEDNIGALGQYLINKTESLLGELGVDYSSMDLIRSFVLFVVLLFFNWFLWWVTRKILIQIIHNFADKSKSMLDDYMVEKRVFAMLANLTPLLFIDSSIQIAFFDYPKLENFFIKVADFAIIIAILLAFIRFLSALEKVLMEKERLKDKPIQSFIQLGQILISIIMVIVSLSILTGQSPMYFITSLGAVSAILLLVFKDTILGFVGSIQLAVNDMIRIGDWITMEKYGADGDVIEISLVTVKVQNFDKTITTIPTYSFIADSFKNWRGMELSDGRRIKRALNIEINSIHFATEELLDELKSIAILSDYIDTKKSEINKYNQENSIDEAYLLNGRRQTNIGLYRQYVTEYLKRNPNINQEMTLMVRQLAPTEIGVPVEIYCFTKSKEWGEYENVMANIFDHLFAATSYFHLNVFERPTGKSVVNAVADS